MVKQVEAICNYTAQKRGELSFRKGAVIYVVTPQKSVSDCLCEHYYACVYILSADYSSTPHTHALVLPLQLLCS